MELPRKMPVNQSERENLGLFYDTYKNKQWFNRAELIPNHPKHMRLTLEIHVNYNPLLEMKEILTFAAKYNYAVDVVDMSHS